jgi:2-oxoisovalerate dehydrogenase E1 component
MIDRNLLLRAYRLMYSVKVMSDTYEANRQVTRYVHSTSRGHEAIQLATAFQLKPSDWVSPYYRDESMLLGMGWTPYQLMILFPGEGVTIPIQIQRIKVSPGSYIKAVLQVCR